MELVFVFILSGMFLKQKITRDKMLALTMILLGAIIVSLRGFENGLLFHRGDFLIFFGVAWFATGSTILKKYLRDLHPEMLIVCRFAAAAFLFFALSPFIEHTIVEEIKSAPIDIIPAILGFGFIARFLYIFCFYEAVEHLPITKVSSFGTLSIIGAAIVAYFYLGEAIEWYHFLGGSLIIAGVLTMQLIGIHINSKRHEHHMKQHHRHHF